MTDQEALIAMLDRIGHKWVQPTEEGNTIEFYVEDNHPWFFFDKNGMLSSLD